MGDERISFRDVKTELLRRITSRVWAPGDLVPGEVELAAEFGVARATVNRAMRELTEEGLLERRRKAGTRVRPSPLRAARFEIPLVKAEIEATGADYGYRRLSRKAGPAPAWLRRALALPDGARVLRVTCLHLASGAPYQHEARWINLAALPAAEAEAFDAFGPNEWLIRAVPFSEVEISFLAVAAEGEVATALGCMPGAPVFAVERTTWWQGQAITHVRLSFAPGHRMTTRY
ncbi:GntR family transcriptional regulator [Frigidibacter sp. RF13]|uniref:GntR family transcriptional regulator n=1 Tax=Frigidibacter sp. RF13 TaxID=2997340 RepID=UPI00226F3485|nr:GntR family transcriptional regulator [Frigidibacter sp. RF13]MCY1127387.1 GntR family transcriptional regulator [Frigidibacter sp. RF13]